MTPPTRPGGARRRLRGRLLAGAVVALVAVVSVACTNSDDNVAVTGNPPSSGALSSGGAGSPGGSVAPSTGQIAFTPLDAGGPVTVKALKDGKIQIAELFSPDPVIKANGWVILKDDKHLQPANHFVAVMRTPKATDAVAAVLAAIDAKLDNDAIAGMIDEVSNDGQNPDDVAAAWLKSQNLPGDLKATGSLTVGSANFASSEVVGWVYAKALEAAGVDVSTKMDLGTREVYIPALEHGDIDLVPEFTASLLSYLDPNTTPSTDPSEGFDQVKAAAAPKGLTVLSPAPADSVNLFVVTSETAKKYHLSTLSDLAKVSEPLTFGGPPECAKRPLCIPGLEKTYGLNFTTS